MAFPIPDIPKTAPAGPPPGGDPADPSHPDNDPVVGLMFQALSNISVPDPAAYTGPYDQASARVRDAYAQAAPAITKALDTLRKGLIENHAQVVATRTAQQGVRANVHKEAEGQVRGFQNEADAFLRAAGPMTDPGNSSVHRAAAAQNAANLGFLQQGKVAAEEFSGQNAALSETMHQDRLATGDQMAEAGRIQAANIHNKAQGAIEAGRAGALAQHASDVQAAENKRLQIQMEIAERMAEANDPLKALRRAVEFKKLRGELEGDDVGLDAESLTPDMFGELATRSPVAFDAFKTFARTITKSEAKDPAKVRKAFDRNIEDAKKEGIYDQKTHSIIYQGKRISIDVLRDWVNRMVGG